MSDKEEIHYQCEERSNMRTCFGRQAQQQHFPNSRLSGSLPTTRSPKRHRHEKEKPSRSNSHIMIDGRRKEVEAAG